MSNLVSANWLQKHLNDENLILLDASIPKVTSAKEIEVVETIPNALFFDIKHKFSDITIPFPNTIPSEQQFEKEVQTLGINTNSKIVVFDNLGVYSSPRAWWLFKTFGFNHVFVLNGGLPEWKRKGFKTISEYSNPNTLGNFKSVFNPNKLAFMESIPALSKDILVSIIDARSSERFNSLVPEPREGLRSGRIPNSLNLPYELVLENGFLQPTEKLQIIFSDLTENTQLVFTCGSGITASILDFAAHEAGYKTTSVYDGSWTEYGTLISE